MRDACTLQGPLEVIMFVGNGLRKKKSMTSVHYKIVFSVSQTKKTLGKQTFGAKGPVGP